MTTKARKTLESSDWTIFYASQFGEDGVRVYGKAAEDVHGFEKIAILTYHTLFPYQSHKVWVFADGPKSIFRKMIEKEIDFLESYRDGSPTPVPDDGDGIRAFEAMIERIVDASISDLLDAAKEPNVEDEV